jgi:ataxia telangiectasia mutated family protein
MEVEALQATCAISRKQGFRSEALAAATYMNDLVPVCQEVGLDIEVTAQQEVANILWDQGEVPTSIRVLQHLNQKIGRQQNGDKNAKSTLLATLVRKIALLLYSR